MWRNGSNKIRLVVIAIRSCWQNGFQDGDCKRSPSEVMRLQVSSGNKKGGNHWLLPPWFKKIKMGLQPSSASPHFQQNPQVPGSQNQGATWSSLYQQQMELHHSGDLWSVGSPLFMGRKRGRNEMVVSLMWCKCTGRAHSVLLPAGLHCTNFVTTSSFPLYLPVYSSNATNWR